MRMTTATEVRMRGDDLENQGAMWSYVPVEHRIPAMYEFREFVSDGGLLSYGPHLMKMFRRSATYADRILNGAKPGATYIVDWIEIRRSLCMVGPPVR